MTSNPDTVDARLEAVDVVKYQAVLSKRGLEHSKVRITPEGSKGSGPYLVDIQSNNREYKDALDSIDRDYVGNIQTEDFSDARIKEVAQEDFKNAEVKDSEGNLINIEEININISFYLVLPSASIYIPILFEVAI